MIKDLIENIVNTYYPDSAFLVADDLQTDRLAIDLQETNYPIIIYTYLSSRYEVNENSRKLIYDSVQITVLNLDSYNNSYAQTEEIVELMKAVSLDINYKLSQNESILGSLIATINKITHYTSTDLSGVGSTFEVSYYGQQSC